MKDLRSDWFDNIRFIATISVIILHVSYPLVYNSNLYSFSWWAGNVLDGSVRYCVPLFVMLSGSLLLPKENIIDMFFIRRLIRIVIPFLFWSLIYLCYDLSILILVKKVSIDTVGLAYFLDKIKHGSWFHLWYVYMIIGIYLFIPIIGRWVRSASQKEILYFLIIWFFTTFLNWPFLSLLKTDLDLSYFSGYIGYLVLGYYLSEFTVDYKLRYLVLTFFTGTVITIFGTYFLTQFNGVIVDSFYNYLTPNVLLSSISVFLITNKILISNHNIKIVRHFICKYSFGIYLIHILVLIVLKKLGIDGEFLNPLFGIPFTTVICLSFSAIIIFLINRYIPFGKYVSG